MVSVHSMHYQLIEAPLKSAPTRTIFLSNCVKNGNWTKQRRLSAASDIYTSRLEDVQMQIVWVLDH